MLPALLLTVREGVSAFLVIAVIQAFFHRVNHPLDATVKLGIATSVMTSGAAAAFFAGADNQALWEGVLALTAVAAVVWLTIYMRKLRRAAPPQPSRAARLGVFLATVLLISRGGMEIALLMGTLVVQVPNSGVLIGVQAGLAAAIVSAFLWTRLAHHARTELLFQATAVFLILLLAHLLADGVHELAESGVVSGSEALHWATLPYSSDGVVGRHAPDLLLAVPVAWLVVGIFWGNGKASDGRDARVDE
jgi:FTR1 family protein